MAKIGIIVLHAFLYVEGVPSLMKAMNETDTQTLIETQPPVSSVLFCGKTEQIFSRVQMKAKHKSYSPIEETDYFTYDEFPHGLKMKRKIFKKLVDAENGQKRSNRST